MARGRPGPGTLLVQVLGGRYGRLLASLAILIIGAPLLTVGHARGPVIDLLVCLIMLTGLIASRPTRRGLIIALVLVAADVLTHPVATWTAIEAFYAVHYTLTLCVLCYATTAILRDIVWDTRVTLETIKGAVSIYLLLGLTWVYIFALIDTLVPGSFSIALSREGQRVGHLVVRHQLPELLYFSFSTITTLGYGDVLPRSAPAKTACYLEAVLGQIYLTVLIARLVGMHITQGPPEDSSA